jgi:exopolysaccharide biosynthesis polyprenyl glycosylphosphotransferase
MNRTGIIIFGDFIAFLIAFVLLIIIRFEVQDYSLAIYTHTIPFIILYISWVLVFYIFGLYDLITIKPTIPYLKRWIMAIICSFAVGIILFYFVPIFGISPKINLIIQVIIFGLLSFSSRRIIYNIFSKIITGPVILVGDSLYLSILEKTILGNPQIGLQIIGKFKKISDIDLTLEKIDNLVIIIDKNIETQDKNILNFYKQGIEIIDTAKAYEKYLYKIPVEYIDSAFIIENVKINKDTLYKIVTFIMNIVFATIILLITSPFLIISAILVYLYDRGPIFYKHKRVGLGGKTFKLYKIRSMNVDAEKDGVKWATGTNDPRITPIGRIIRKLHLDEIPQMISILKGDMSLVGPRPERPEFVELLNKEIPYYSLRHVIRPGFTGWAQIKYRYARSVEDSKEKFEYDLYYIKNKNIFLDFGIILRTIQIIFIH